MSGEFFQYSVHAEGAIDDLKLAQKNVRLYAQRGLRKGIKDIAVPRAKEMVPHHSGKLAATMKASVTGLTGYLQSNSPYAGLIEFGGVRRDHIDPVVKRAVTPAPGVAVAYVSTPRTYVGKHRMLAAAQASVAEIAAITEQAVLQAFAEYFIVT